LSSTLPYTAAPDKLQIRPGCVLNPDELVIIQVLAGALSAADAAIELGVSRQTVYRRLNKAAAGIKAALTPMKPGPAPAKVQDSAQLVAAQQEISAQRRDIAILKAIHLLLLALLKAAGVLADYRYLRLSAEDKLSLVETMDAFVAAGGYAKTFAATIGQTYSKLLGWRKRIQGLSREEALAVLTDKSSAADHEQVSDAVKQAVLNTKQLHPSWSCRQIANCLGRRWHDPIRIGKTAVHEILRIANPQEPPDQAHRRKLHTFACKGAAFCVDFMHVQIGLCTYKVCFVIDEATRYIAAWSVTQKTSSRLVISLIRQAALRLGHPLLVKSDNGPEFRSTFAGMLAARGIFHLPSPCYYAPFNGKVERVFGKLRRFLRYAPHLGSAWALRRQVAAFVTEHNTMHTNKNLGDITPQEALRLGGPVSLPDTTERIKAARQDNCLVLHFTNRYGQPARRELRLA
jgi:transposase InsO family protein/predicted DNA-binding protein (UPF0251 family)